MTLLLKLEKAWDLLYGTPKIRRTFEVALALLSIALGPFLRVLFLMPRGAVLDVIYLYGFVLAATGFMVSGAFLRPVKSVIGSLFLGWKYKPRPFTPEEYRYYDVAQIVNEMGIGKKNVRIYETTNPLIDGPFTNAFNNKVYIPLKWKNENPRLDLRGVIGHELDHVKTKVTFLKELVAVSASIVGLSFLVGMYSLPVVTETFELSLTFLFLSLLSWRNERRADKEGALVTGPEGLISVFERLRTTVKRDVGSDSHPPLSDRIARLLPLLDVGPT